MDLDKETKEITWSDSIEWARENSNSKTEKSSYTFWIILAGILFVILVIWMGAIYWDKYSNQEKQKTTLEIEDEESEEEL
jgi:flagellar basal body-associated protein FliL